MEKELFWKKVYSVAYRLTGNENNASEMASLAILHTANDLAPDGQITACVFQSTLVELINIFLNTQKICYNNTNNYIRDIQTALLVLKPICRAAVIWKDVLGFQISDNMPAANYSRQELLRELVYGRRELKEYLLNKG